jgi:hypothetical protein
VVAVNGVVLGRGGCSSPDCRARRLVPSGTRPLGRPVLPWQPRNQAVGALPAGRARVVRRRLWR